MTRWQAPDISAGNYPGPAVTDAIPLRLDPEHETQVGEREIRDMGLY
jgi:hypothetical protein